MHGIVSLLDPIHDAEVKSIWRELDARFGLKNVAARVPFPHYSHMIFPEFDLARVEDGIRQVASRFAPFTVRCAGLGVFSGSSPVLYIAVTHSPQLSALHRRVWQICEAAVREPPDYYRPERWMPHITLAEGDLTAENLADAMRWLGGQSLDWEIRCDNLTLGEEASGVHRATLSVKLGG